MALPGPRIRVFPVGEKLFAGQLLDFEGSSAPTVSNTRIDTIVILDRSGSMSSIFKDVLSVLLPQALLKLKYEATDKVTLITFDSATEVFATTVGDLAKLPIGAQGCTYMAAVFPHLQTLLVDPNVGYRILAISDGDLGDQEQSVKASLEVSRYIQAQNLRVSAQAIRYFTSSNQPDTRGLASVLQLSTVCQPALVDLPQPHDVQTEAVVLAELFNDGLESRIVVQSQNPCWLSTPWSTSPADQLAITQQTSIVWLQSLPVDPKLGDGVAITVESGEKLSMDNLTVVEKAIRAHIQMLRVCQVVGNQDLASQIAKYLQDLQRQLEFNTPDTEADTSGRCDPLLGGRLAQLRKLIARRQKSIFTELAHMGNVENVSKLNSLQQANYLRTVEQSKNARGLARIALAHDTDFSEVVRREIAAMSSHLEELAGIDDSTHTKSFFCQGTTLEGIQAVCQLTADGLLESCELDDVLSMLNIVGLACFTPYGDYPDAMTWRVHDLFPCFVSIADIITAKRTSNGMALKAPGTDGCEITNVIPIYEDPKIHKFLLRHAPTTLDLVAGYGMRQIMAIVPRTYMYTLCGGVWKLVQDIQVSPLQFHRNLLQQVTNEFVVASGSFFDHIVPLLAAAPLDRRSFYLGNNGLTNLIVPLIKLHRQNGTFPSHLGAILRALYSFEVFMVTKKWFRDDQKSSSVQELLHKLLSIDLTSHASPVSPLFEPDVAPSHYSHFTLNLQESERLAKQFWYLEQLPALPTLLIDPMHGGAVECPEEVLGLQGMSLPEFRCYNIIQSLLANEKSLRVGENMMLIDDMGFPECAHEMCSRYVAAQFEAQYVSALKAKAGEERRVLSERLVQQLLQAELDEFFRIFRVGLTVGPVSHSISTDSSLGFSDLLQALLCTSTPIPGHLQKLRCLVTGRDQSGETVWNRGSCLHIDMNLVKPVFLQYGQPDAFEELLAYWKASRLHRYRAATNHHGHGNDKPSYWALGFSTIEEMKAEVSAEKWSEYCALHRGCCGLK